MTFTFVREITELHHALQSGCVIGSFNVLLFPENEILKKKKQKQKRTGDQDSCALAHVEFSPGYKFH